MVSWTTPNHKQRFSFCLSSWCQEKVFLFWAGFGRDHFEINSSKLTFPNIPSFQGRARVFRRSREKEPMQSSRSFLGVWLWPRSSAAAQAWSRLEDPFWPGSPWLSLPSWPCLVLSWAFGPKVTQLWIKLRDCSPWGLLMPAHWGYPSPEGWGERDRLIFCPCHHPWQPEGTHRACFPTWKRICVSCRICF